MSMDATKYKPYPAYKESGVEWLGEVPNHWQISPLKYGFRVVGGSTPKSDNEVYWDGDIIWITPSDLSKISSMGIRDSQRKITTEGLASCGTTLVPSGSIIISTRAPIGSVAIAEVDLCTNQGCKSLVPNKNIQSKFYEYLLSINTDELNIRGKGTTFLELSGDELGAFEIPVPPIAEQHTIAAFLDRETAKIDTLIAKQERLIELLGEKRTVLISHAVTKGLNPDAPMKNSGVEWLGEVPAHWVFGRFLYACDIMVDGTHFSPESNFEGEYLYITAKNIKESGFDFSEITYVSSKAHREIFSRCPVQKGDVLYIKDGATAGIAMVNNLDEEFSLLSSVALIRPKPKLFQPKFVSYQLNAGVFKNNVLSQLIGGAMTRFTLDMISRFIMVRPPLKEQHTIAAFLDRETTKIGTLIAKARRAIDLLKERRTALISAAVTGKIDVREAFPSVTPE